MRNYLLVLALTLFLATDATGESAFDILYGSKNNYKDVAVDEVLSVDTFLIYIDGAAQRVRMIGLRGPGEAPKQIDKREVQGEMGFIMQRPQGRANPVSPLETQAFDFVRELIEGKHVRLEFDVNKTDEGHYSLAYVYLVDDDTFVNEEILRAGFANLSIQPPNTKYSKKLREAYLLGRSERRGLHSR